MARFVLRTREHLGLLLAEGDALVLLQMRYASELHPPDDLALPRDAEIGKAEMDMAARLIDALSMPWVPGQYQDTYTEDLKSMILEKIKGVERQVIEEPYPTEVTDLYVQLSRSVQAAQESQNPGR